MAFIFGYLRRFCPCVVPLIEEPRRERLHRLRTELALEFTDAASNRFGRGVNGVLHY
jgi:hypothetical protein